MFNKILMKVRPIYKYLSLKYDAFRVTVGFVFRLFVLLMSIYLYFCSRFVIDPIKKENEEKLMKEISECKHKYQLNKCFDKKFKNLDQILIEDCRKLEKCLNTRDKAISIYISEYIGHVINVFLSDISYNTQIKIIIVFVIVAVIS